MLNSKRPRKWSPDADHSVTIAEERGVQVRRYEIIYQVTDDLRNALEGMLAPEKRETELGRALVQRTFSISRIGVIAGCRVISGIIARNGRLLLDPGGFYILASKGAVEIPVMEAAEMTPIDPSVGEFRVHYAGFFDPGFGTDEAHGAGSKGVLEVRTHDTPFLLEHGQIVARLVYEPLTERPSRLYGESGSHYQNQGLKLSKHFQAFDPAQR